MDFKQDYKIDVLPVCGRLALAAIPGFQSARYMFTEFKSFHLQPDALPTWSECLHVKQTNCRKAYYCWESAIKRLCAISDKCCNRQLGNVSTSVEESARKTHDACIENPDSKLGIQLGITNRESFKHLRYLPVLKKSRCALKLGLSG
eukprot:TRINITY_DN6320_c0_g1_i3.p1 TRINITY_DN6320_c0_g1~~TRINITY_DN6320_c0_g1_i3.p1  ORF type:complete len:147 (-),score=5.26 TRINITY_DN6320_c0_g1_i3:99-539(-)